MAESLPGILMMFLLALILLGRMRMLRRREEVYLDRIEAYLNTIGNESAALQYLRAKRE